jgi:hypothetical protein
LQFSLIFDFVLVESNINPNGRVFAQGRASQTVVIGGRTEQKVREPMKIQTCGTASGWAKEKVFFARFAESF